MLRRSDEKKKSDKKRASLQCDPGARCDWHAPFFIPFLFAFDSFELLYRRMSSWTSGRTSDESQLPQAFLLFLSVKTFTSSSLHAICSLPNLHHQTLKRQSQQPFHLNTFSCFSPNPDPNRGKANSVQPAFTQSRYLDTVTVTQTHLHESLPKFEACLSLVSVKFTCPRFQIPKMSLARHINNTDWLATSHNSVTAVLVARCRVV
jgi:hypothetical protein